MQAYYKMELNYCQFVVGQTVANQVIVKRSKIYKETLTSFFNLSRARVITCFKLNSMFELYINVEFDSTKG